MALRQEIKMFGDCFREPFIIHAGLDLFILASANNARHFSTRSLILFSTPWSLGS